MAAFLSSLFAILTLLSWRRWPDFLIDFGRDVYLSWQLAEDPTSYADFAYVFGPLPVYFNAVWFKIFGASLTTLIVVNLVLLAALVYLLYDLLHGSFGRFCATACTAAFLVTFAFSHFFLDNGNYNYVLPYSQAMTHGILLCVLMIWCKVRSVRAGSAYGFLLAGISFGMTFLTKPEFFLAASAATAVSFTVLIFARRARVLNVAQAVRWFLAGSIIGPAGFLAFFFTQMPWPEAFRAVASAFSPLGSFRPALQPYYLGVSGLDRPLVNLSILIVGSIYLVSGTAAIIFLDRKWSKRRYGTLVGFVAGLVFAAPLTRPPFWPRLGIVLPVTSLLVGAWCLAKIRKQPLDRARLNDNYGPLLWAALAFTLLFKTILNSRLYHYGAFLSFPAAVLLWAALLAMVPRALEARWRGGQTFRYAALTLVIFIAAPHGSISLQRFLMRNVPVGAGGDRLYLFDASVDPRTEAILRTLDSLRELGGDGGTLASIPDGALFNFITRRKNPTPYLSLWPPEVDGYGEEEILRSFVRTLPNIVLLIRLDTRTEYGVGPFGEDRAYGARIAEWLHATYDTARIIDAPGSGRGAEAFTIEILVRPPP